MEFSIGTISLSLTGLAGLFNKIFRRLPDKKPEANEKPDKKPEENKKPNETSEREKLKIFRELPLIEKLRDSDVCWLAGGAFDEKRFCFTFEQPKKISVYWSPGDKMRLSSSDFLPSEIKTITLHFKFLNEEPFKDIEGTEVMVKKGEEFVKINDLNEIVLTNEEASPVDFYIKIPKNYSDKEARLNFFLGFNNHDLLEIKSFTV